VIEKPTGSIPVSERVKRKAEAHHACFKELGRLVGSCGNRVRELKILDQGVYSSSPWEV